MMSKSGEEIKFKTFLSLSEKKIIIIWQQIIKWLSLSPPPSQNKFTTFYCLPRCLLVLAV
jgi:hypothetical protein